MRFLNLRLQDFRNIEFTELSMEGDRIFLFGANGQGKSNLLEALGLVTALRSFRTQNLSALPRKGCKEYTLVYTLEDAVDGLTELEIHFGPGGRRVEVDGEKVTRLSDFIGRFPTVTLCSGDLMLLRGSPGERRRFMDLMLSVADRRYYSALRGYHKGVAERNRLLKKGGSGAEFSAFEAEMAERAQLIMEIRHDWVDVLSETLRSIYDGLAEADEGPEMRFRANADCGDVEGFQRLFADSRARDQILGASQRGPHRDDFTLNLQVGGAKEYASDGQQRGLCLALRIAQAAFYRDRLGRTPVILADDVLGELDPIRRAGFWRVCPKEMQIVATGTELPGDAESWSVASIKRGFVGG